MATRVGLQSSFSKALYELCELDFDAIGAYEAAIERLENEIFKAKLTEFKADHERHTQELSSLLREHNEEPPKGPDATKSLLAKGKVVISGFKNDNSILKAMKTNEDDTNDAYERMCSRNDIWQDAVSILEQGWVDEKRHRMWIEDNIR